MATKRKTAPSVHDLPLPSFIDSAKSVTIVGLDPGFASFGWAMIEIAPAQNAAGGALQPRVTPRFCGVIRTAKAAKKESLFAAEDMVQRAAILHADLALVIRHADLVSAESLSYPRSASVSAQMGCAWGVLVGILAHHTVPLVQLSPQAAKKRITGLKSASKLEVQSAVEGMLPGAVPMIEALNPGLREHVADAFALALCAVDSEQVRGMLKILHRGMLKNVRGPEGG